MAETPEAQYQVLAEAWLADVRWQIERCRDGGKGYPENQTPLEALEGLIGVTNCYSEHGAGMDLVNAIRAADEWANKQQRSR